MDPLKELEKLCPKPGLERISKALNYFGNPDKNFSSVLVSGTNGKGSTTCFLHSILRENGMRSCAFFSPHLVSPSERFVFDSEIDEATLNKLAWEVLDYVESGNELTYFESLTLMACLWFSDVRADIAVFEVGMGGRLDATNAIHSEGEIITNVSMDHTAHLGENAGDIAKEKAGIIKRNSWVVSGCAGLAESVVRKEAKSKNASLSELGEHFHFELSSLDFDGTSFRFFSDGKTEEFFSVLCGSFQPRNASLAIMASCNLGFSPGDCSDGIRNAFIRGRMETLFKTPRVVFDSAHNIAGIEECTRTLSMIDEFSEKVCVFGVLSDKDWMEMASMVYGFFDSVFLCMPDSNRALDPEKVREFIGDGNVVRSPRSAISEALSVAESSGLVCILGSTYLYQDAYEFFSLPGPQK